MANAFSDDRISLWHSSPDSFNLPGTIKKWGVTDVMLPHTATLVQMERVRALDGWDGKKVRAHVFIDGTHGESGATLAGQATVAAAKLKPGVIEVDIESGDDNFIGSTAREFLTIFRDGPQWRFNIPICINVVPLKGYVLPFSLMTPDPNTYGRIQLFYGAEMRVADPDECRWDWTHRGFPEERLTFMYSAHPRRQKPDAAHPDGEILCDLPVFGDGGQYVRKLRRGGIFNANLMLDAELI